LASSSSSSTTASSPSGGGFSGFKDKFVACFKEGGLCGCCQAIGWRGRVRLFANVGVFLVALEHIFFFIVQTFLFTSSVGTGFYSGVPSAILDNCAAWVGKSGVYDLSFALGLLWGLFTSMFSFGKRLPTWRGWGADDGESPHQRWHALHIKVFFLVSIIGVGIQAGLQVMLSLLLIQSIPAFVVLLLVLIGGPGTEQDA